MSGFAYFNEFDRHAAAWLRELIRQGYLPDGEVDERSIADVVSADLTGFRQCHFFAGIGGWPYALRLAGWPDDRPVWTGSCPCQPYSPAGKGEGDKDPRNLWPEFFRLIRECRPDCVFGEQVEGAIRHGWLCGVQRDLEGEGYAVGHCVLGAHSVFAPHIRQRLYWVADAQGERRRPRRHGVACERPADESLRLRAVGVALGDANSTGPQVEPAQGSTEGRAVGWAGPSCGLDDADGERRDGQGVHAGRGRPGQAAPLPERAGESGDGFWDAFDLLPCRDGKARRVEPGTFPLAHGVSGRVAVVRPERRGIAEIAEEDVRWVNRTGALKGFGNAIVPQDAVAFIEAYLEVTEGIR